MLDLNNKDLKSSHLINITNILKIIEPATIIAILFGATYFYGWIYIKFYFAAFGIQHKYLDLPIYFYVNEAILPLIFILLISWWSLSGENDNISTIKQSIRHNVLILIAAIIIFFLGIKEYPINRAYILFTISVFILILFIIALITKFSLLTNWKNFDMKEKITYTILFFMFFFIVAAYSGAINAINTIEGTSTVEIVNFSWKDNPPEEFKNKELILVMHYKENFYVIEKQKPAPDYPELFIIPDDKIKYATIKRSNPIRNFLNKI